MTQQIARGNNNVLVDFKTPFIMADDGLLGVYGILGYAFYNIRIYGGTVTLNGTKIFALCQSQSKGATLDPSDYVGVVQNDEQAIAVRVSDLLINLDVTMPISNEQIVQQESKVREELVQALRDMCREFGGHAHKYDSAAYAKATRLINLYAK